MTRVLADTHLHLYPCYDFPAAIAALAANLAAHGQGTLAGFFAERSDCRAFAAIREGSHALPAGGDRELRPLREEGAVALFERGAPLVYLFAGRQIVTAERIEVLALAVDLRLPDGLPAAETIDAVIDAGGVPVLGWSPGKWWFARGSLVRELLRRRKPGELLLGDTALRPNGTREPRAMREARRLGFGVVAGSDPLPFPGEERLLGSYASVFKGTVDPERPVESARRLLRTAAATSGARGSWAAAAGRWWRNARAAGKAGTCAA